MEELKAACEVHGVNIGQALCKFKITAIKEYLKTANIKPIIQLIETEGEIDYKKGLVFTACRIMYKKKNTEILNSLFSCIGSEYIAELCYQLEINLPKNNILENATLLRLLSQCDYLQLREILIDKDHVDRRVLLNQSSKLHYIMREKKVSYEEALNLFQCWSLPIAVQIWFTQGIQLLTITGFQ